LIPALRRAAAVLLAVSLAGCAAQPPAAPIAAAPRTETIWVVERGWHTDIAIDAATLGPALDDLRAAFPGVRVFLFGFGERAWLLKRHHGVGDMLGTLFPNPGAILVTALRTAPDAAFPDSDIVAMPITKAQRDRLEAFLTAALARDPAGHHRIFATGPYPGSAFYPSTATYSLIFTCNTWTAEGLQAAGLPVYAQGVLFAGDVMRQAHRTSR
jgi:uncharacterized protein (TIGR02117 family)